MLNLFRKFAGNEVAVAEKAQLKGKTTNQIIEEIHESFFTEVDKLLADAKIAKSLDTDKQGLLDKCARLKSLGFTNTKEVKEAEAEIKRLENLKKENEAKKTLMDAINYFSFKYPNYKFITEESVKRICQKYGLVYGEIQHYTGTVPDKNLAQMEKFKIDERDELYFSEHWIEGFRSSSKSKRIHDFDEYGGYIKRKEFKKEEALTMARNYSLAIGQFRERWAPSPLEIAAPVKDFNMNQMELKDFKISEIEIPDPVVLKPVIFNKEKFYLIVTAWGIEASDSEVVNERMN